MLRRVEEALEERKRQRRKTSATPDPYPEDRRSPIAGRRDKDPLPASPAAPANAAAH
jgi:hypothetical protein